MLCRIVCFLEDLRKLASAESYNGFNHAICMGCDPEKGGSADGFDAKSEQQILLSLMFMGTIF